jgi:3-methyladenine DNA glycosylase AlkD
VPADTELVADLRQALAEHADPDRAPDMQRYMKSALPFRGLTSPVLRATVRPLLSRVPAARADREATIRLLWDEAAFREERYAALALLEARPLRGWRDPDLVPLVEHLVRTGAWWDLVDQIAGRTVAPMHREQPRQMRPVVLAWSRHEDLWLRRTAVLSQLGSKAATDRDLLAQVVLANADRTEFWLRKAIGWALRDLARTDPGWVRAFLATHGDRLSALSRREAAKHLGGEGDGGVTGQ